MKRNKKDHDDEYRDRTLEFLATAEQAAMYLHGLADGIATAAAMKGETPPECVRRLRIHAGDLTDGRLFIEHGYRELQAESR